MAEKFAGGRLVLLRLPDTDLKNASLTRENNNENS
jgi:hypothetical protein